MLVYIACGRSESAIALTASASRLQWSPLLYLKPRLSQNILGHLMRGRLENSQGIVRTMICAGSNFCKCSVWNNQLIWSPLLRPMHRLSENILGYLKRGRPEFPLYIGDWKQKPGASWRISFFQALSYFLRQPRFDIASKSLMWILGKHNQTTISIYFTR